MLRGKEEEIKRKLRKKLGSVRVRSPESCRLLMMGASPGYTNYVFPLSLCGTHTHKSRWKSREADFPCVYLLAKCSERQPTNSGQCTKCVSKNGARKINESLSTWRHTERDSIIIAMVVNKKTKQKKNRAK